jgi:hypothetical protein
MRNKNTSHWLTEQKNNGIEIDENDRPKRLPTSWINAEIKKRTPDAIVLPGDTIIASKMKIVSGDQPFQHKHDLEGRCLSIDIVNSDGTRKEIGESDRHGRNSNYYTSPALRAFI